MNKVMGLTKLTNKDMKKNLQKKAKAFNVSSVDIDDSPRFGKDNELDYD